MPVNNDTSPAEALGAVRGYFERLDLDRAAFRDWAAGTVNGGPGNDGRYPLLDYTGDVHLVPSPAKIAALSGGSDDDIVAVASIRLFTDIATADLPADVQILRTLGYSVAGIGSATYRKTANTGARAWRTQSLDGAWWELDEREPYVDFFGAIYDDPAFDSWPAIQAAIDWNEARSLLEAGTGTDTWDDADGLAAIQTASGWAGDATTFEQTVYGVLGWTGDFDLLRIAYEAALAWAQAQNLMLDALGHAIDYSGDPNVLIDIAGEAFEWNNTKQAYIDALVAALPDGADATNIQGVASNVFDWTDRSAFSILEVAVRWTDDRITLINAIAASMDWAGSDATYLALVDAAITWATARRTFFENLADSRKGGVIAFSGGRTYYCSQTIRFDPTRTSIRGNGCNISHTLKTFQDFALQPELATNHDFNSGATGWELSEYDRGNIVFASGKATHQRIPVHPAGTPVSYAEFGQKVNAPVGTKLRIRARFNYIDTVVDMNSNTPFSGAIIGVGRQRNKAGQLKTLGSIPIFASRSFKNNDPRYGEPWDVEFDVALVSPADANPWIRVQSNASFELESLSVKAVPDNACIRVTGENEQFGHNKHFVEGINLQGKPAQWPLVDGIVFSSARPKSSRIIARSIMTEGAGIARAAVFENATYLCSFFGCVLNGRTSSIDTLEGADDAGENINFYGCVFAANRGVTVRNRGMGFYFSQCSFDFPLAWYKGKGQAFFQNCHFEKFPNSDVQIAQFPYLLHVEQGAIFISGGRLQIDHGKWGTLEAPFCVDKDARLYLNGVNCSFMPASADAMCVGEGYFYSRNMQGGSAMPRLAKRDQTHNLFASGGFETSDTLTDNRVPINAWLDSFASNGVGVAKDVIDRFNLGWIARLALPGTSVVGSDIITGMTLAGGNVLVGDIVRGPGIPANAAVVSIDGPGDMVTLSQKAYATGAGPFTYEQPSYSGTAKLEMDTAIFRSGARSLKATKSAGLGSSNPLRVNFAYPIEQMARTGFEFYYRVDPEPGAPAASTFNLFVQAYFVSLRQTGLVPEVTQRLYAGLDISHEIDRQAGRRVASVTGSTTLNSNIVTNANWLRESLAVGQTIRGPGIASGTTITALNETAKTITLSQVATLTDDGPFEVILSHTWNEIGFSTNLSSPTLEHRGFAPAWATHVWIFANLLGMPAGAVHFDDFMASLY